MTEQGDLLLLMEGSGQGPAENLPPEPPAADDDGFSFPVPPLAADACFVPVYPVFGRTPSPPPGEAGKEEEDEPGTATVRVPLGRLLLEERGFRARQQGGRSASARALLEEGEGRDEELEGVPPESYCLWAPGGQSSAPASPRRCRKSGSTGSVLRWRRISERLVGRSHSDGKEKFVFLTAAAAGPEPPPPPPLPVPSNKEEGEGEGSGKGSKGDAGGGGHGWGYYRRGSGRRRSYLPYKQDLVGLFANVSGIRRSYHPF